MPLTNMVTQKEPYMETLEKESCLFEDREYSDGAELCQGDECKVCVDGRLTEWQELCCPHMVED